METATFKHIERQIAVLRVMCYGERSQRLPATGISVGGGIQSMGEYVDINTDSSDDEDGPNKFPPAELAFY